MNRECDFSKGERGKFYRPNLVSAVLVLLAVALARGEAPSGPHQETEAEQELSFLTKLVAQESTTVASRMREIANILEERAKRRIQEAHVSEVPAFRYLLTELQIKSSELKSELLALQVGEADLVILWKDPVKGRILPQEEVLSFFGAPTGRVRPSGAAILQFNTNNVPIPESGGTTSPHAATNSPSAKPKR